MSEARFPEVQPIATQPAQQESAAAPGPTCEECLGSGGWYRYEPALEPVQGLLYLSCLHCRGQGRTPCAHA